MIRPIYIRGCVEFLRSWFHGSSKAGTSTAASIQRQAQFERLPMPLHHVVILGGSRVEGCEFGVFYSGASNRGIEGDTSAGILRRLDSNTKLNPAAFLLMIGSNDVYQAFVSDEMYMPWSDKHQLSSAPASLMSHVND